MKQSGYVYIDKHELRQLNADVVHLRSLESECRNDLIDARAALAHERDRAKRVVRVFWRVRYTHDGAPAHDDFRTREGCEMFLNCLRSRKGFKVYRVTVRRKKK